MWRPSTAAQQSASVTYLNSLIGDGAVLFHVPQYPLLFPSWLSAPRRGSHSVHTPAEALKLTSGDANKQRTQTCQLTVAECYWEAAPSPRLEREKLIMEPH